MVVGREELLHDLRGSEKGAMMVVEGDLETVKDVLAKSGNITTIAFFNGPRCLAMAGTRIEMKDVAETLQQPGFSTMCSRILDTTNAFHSALADKPMPQLPEVSHRLSFNEPMITLESATESKWPASIRLAVDYDAEHMRQRVHYNQAMQRLAQQYPDRELGKDYIRPEAWDVLAQCEKVSDKSFVTDLFVFDAVRGHLVDVILGIDYHKLWELASLSAKQERRENQLTLADISIDSLMIIELGKGMEGAFNAPLVRYELAYVTTVRELLSPFTVFEAFEEAKPFIDDLVANSCAGYVDDVLPRLTQLTITLEHSSVNRLKYFAGSRLAEVLRGEQDGSKLIFGTDEGWKLLIGLYGDSLPNNLVNPQMRVMLTRLIGQLEHVDGLILP
ncbi:hypothetical protein VPNG_07979 [Cytospora leucostoma]|uniref:Malonyl-CoA:ACP transacylase (MAT) domain-containing protein n=1 Tax=Cytospora leucostoma TaxID=1230097 RepID=A0A423WQW2_9PEZI|nr:hypothetical protein VPNG_07979 [Cytospora leucostoma]